MNNCPYCGATWADSTIVVLPYSVKCSKCGLTGPSSISLDEAIVLWNKIELRK